MALHGARIGAGYGTVHGAESEIGRADGASGGAEDGPGMRLYIGVGTQLAIEDMGLGNGEGIDIKQNLIIFVRLIIGRAWSLV